MENSENTESSTQELREKLTYLEKKGKELDFNLGYLQAIIDIHEIGSKEKNLSKSELLFELGIKLNRKLKDKISNEDKK